MCGIAVIFSYHPAASPVDRPELWAIRDRMTPRGPDGAGEWFSQNGRLGMGHRRLSIIDLSEAAAQPMESKDGSCVLVFNGEIYNYRKLREELKQKGHRFKSNSDTEVLLHLYQEKGEAMVRDLRGMFAFAIWDSRKNALFLARDSYGMKPLYYADDGRTFRAASQVKALLAGGKISNDPEPAGTAGFFLTGSVPEPFTTYREIRQVPAGSFIWVHISGPTEPQLYSSIASIFSDAAKNRRHFSAGHGREYVRGTLLDSVRHHFVSDVPVGAFLSGGIDSGALISLAYDLGIRDLKTVTVAFDEFHDGADDETAGAHETARLYGTQHSARKFTNTEFRHGLDAYFEAMDQPTVDGINTYFASRAAQEAGLKVVLSGLGGDELFGSYLSFRRIPKSVCAFQIPSQIPFLGEWLRRSYSSVGTLSSSHPKWGGLLQYGGTCAGAYLLERGLFMPWELETILDPDVVREGMKKLRMLERIEEALEPDPKNWFARVATLETSFYLRNQLLRDADWAGMAHSLEIRMPFVDIQLLRMLAPVLISSKISDLKKKTLLTQSCKTRLPEPILNRPKKGFLVPMDQWLNTEKEIDSWRKVPALNRESSWARRWAYVVMERQKVVQPLALAK